jgi:hypothetical protein
VQTILFTGHRLDDANRPVPRFPPQMEASAHAAIRGSVRAILREHGSGLGIAGGASGGDILFHEVCAELGVPTRLYLPLPMERFVAESVAPAGEEWVRRFRAIAARVPVIVEPPSPTGDEHSDGPWERINLQLLAHALEQGASHVTVLALWNRRPGDGRGGTEHLVEQARAQGVDVRILDTNTIFDL